MSDAMSHARKQQGLWDDARYFTGVYFGKVEPKAPVSNEWIEKWLSRYGWTPKEMAEELGIEIKNESHANLLQTVEYLSRDWNEKYID